MRAPTLLCVAGLALSATSGCNPGTFDSLLDEAPVVVFTPSGSSTGSLHVLPLPPDPNGTAAARMLVSRQDSGYLAVAEFDRDGKVEQRKASDAERANLGGDAVFGAAVRADGLIMLGMPRTGGGATPGGAASSLTLVPSAGGGYSFVAQPALQGGGQLTRVGINVAAGRVTGGAVEDFVVLGDNSVHVVGADGRTQVAGTTCQSVQLGSATDYYAFRPVAVGDLLTGGFDEIVLGSQGKVAFLQWNGGTELTCLPTHLTMGASIGFGASVAVANFGDTPHLDLAVGSPPDKVYVYFGPLDRVDGPRITTITSTLPGTAFGQRVAAYQLPGTATAQLLVADPRATVGKLTGKVMLFSVDPNLPALTDTDAAATLFDSDEDSDPGFFGTNLGGLVFNTQLCVPGAPLALVPWASNNLDVLTFFNYPPTVTHAATDPRCFALQP